MGFYSNGFYCYVVVYITYIDIIMRLYKKKNTLYTEFYACMK